jgi:hypothetical protein
MVVIIRFINFILEKVFDFWLGIEEGMNFYKHIYSEFQSRVIHYYLTPPSGHPSPYQGEGKKQG